MSPIILNDPLNILWQTNLYDALMLTIFISAAVYAALQFRRGHRIYAVLLFAALIYGQVLELAGMATLNMYVQGDFALMLNYPAVSLFEGTTAMPFYVTIFYPVIFFVGFKVIESLGIKKDWQAAVAGGLFLICLDAPYIIEGNLRHIIWWTWDADFTMFQYFVGWPLVDLCWQATWGAPFFYVMRRALPRIDGPSESRWSNGKAFGVFAPLSAIGVICCGPILLAPVTVVGLLGGPQWPLVVALVAGYIAVTAVALRSADPAPRIEPITAWAVGLYVASFASMLGANVFHEGGITLYIVVQAVGLVAMVAMTAFPAVARRRQGEALATDEPAGVAH